MRDMMQEKVGIIRTKAELEEAINDLKAFSEREKKCFPELAENTTRDGIKPLI